MADADPKQKATRIGPVDAVERLATMSPAMVAVSSVGIESPGIVIVQSATSPLQNGEHDENT